MEDKLLKVLRRTSIADLLLLTIDRVENMVLLMGLELLRWAFNVHNRGLILGSADRLDHFINVCKANTQRDVFFECGSFADVVCSSTTVWNDDEIEKQDCLRDHLIHFQIEMKVGQGINVYQKRLWNGTSLEGLKITDRENKRRLRLVKCNEDVALEFTKPVFDPEKGTFNRALAASSLRSNPEHPLLPIEAGKMKRIYIK